MLISCRSSVVYQWYQPSPEVLEPKDQVLEVISRAVSKTPDTLTQFFLNVLPPYEIRVQVHVMQDEFGRNNFSEDSGPAIIRSIIADANLGLANNQKMWLPKGNETEVWPTGYQYVLVGGEGDTDGIFFHRDKDSLFYLINRGKFSNLGDERVFKKYGSGGDTILNIFVMANHPDSARSSTYVRTDNGIAFSTWVKVVNWYENMRDTVWDGTTFSLPKGSWYCKNLLNHEIGHVLGLRHAWTYSDGCEDTPTHDNCWNFTVSGPCKEGVSNNVMDYNTYQNAWTPCQIERIRRIMTQANSSVRKLIRPIWYPKDSIYKLVVDDPMTWSLPVDLAGDLIINSGVILSINQTVNMPPDGEIQIMPGAQLHLGELGMITHLGASKWKGIKLMGKKRERGAVVIHPEGKLNNMKVTYD